MPYEFTHDSYRTFTDDVIKAAGDQATLTPILTDLQDTYFASIANLDKINNELESIKAENERLRESNLNLFRRLGDDIYPNNQDKEETKIEKVNSFNSVNEFLNSLEDK